MAALTVGELDLDLDAFEGPFDLLLTLVLRDELPLREVDLAEIVIAFLQHLEERGRLDLDACGEFLVLISALLELKARGLFPEEDAELAELEPEVAAEELARRLAEYRRAKEGAEWLAARLEAAARRGSSGSARRRSPPARPEPELGSQPPEALAEAIRALAVEPPAPVDRAHGARVPAGRALPRALAVAAAAAHAARLRPGGRGLARVEIAVAFLALLELAKQRELAISQAAPFAPIRITRAERRKELTRWRGRRWIAHSG